MVTDYRINPKKEESLVTIEESDDYIEYKTQKMLDNFLKGTKFYLEEGSYHLRLVMRKLPWYNLLTGHESIAEINISRYDVSVRCESCYLAVVKKLFEDFSQKCAIKVVIKIDAGDC